MGVILHAHPFMLSRTFNATPAERLQQQQLIEPDAFSQMKIMQILSLPDKKYFDTFTLSETSLEAIFKSRGRPA